MATPIESNVFDGTRLFTLRQSLCSLRDQVKTLNASEEAQKELEGSARILTDWLTMHFNEHNPTSTAPDIWGDQGWVRMQDLLAELSGKIDAIQIGLQPMSKVKERSEAAIQESPHLRGLSNSAVELHESLKLLVIFSGIRFRVNHPETDLIRPALEDAVQARRGAYILYDAIQAKGFRCDLNIDLFSGNPASVIKFQEPRLESRFHRRLCYQLIFRDSNRNDLLLQDVNHRRDIGNTAGSITYENAISVFGPLQPRMKVLHCIQRGPFDRQTYFHVSDGTDHTSAGSPLSDYLEACPSNMDEQHWKQSKLLLAFQLSECALNLMGTPFLAHLCVADIFVHKFETKTMFTLALPTLSAKDQYWSNTQSLLESHQLLNLGMVLIEIALGPLKHYETKSWSSNTKCYAAELLPHVRRTMGDTYHEICAFCVEDWYFEDDYTQFDRWDGAEESGWNVWLRDFLRVYDSFVVEGYVTKAFHCSDSCTFHPVSY